MDEAAFRAAGARLVAVLGGPRRVVAAALIAVAVLAGLRVISPAPAPTVAVWAAARDLAGGHPLGTGDVARLVPNG